MVETLFPLKSIELSPPKREDMFGVCGHYKGGWAGDRWKIFDKWFTTEKAAEDYATEQARTGWRNLIVIHLKGTA